MRYKVPGLEMHFKYFYFQANISMVSFHAYNCGIETKRLNEFEFYPLSLFSLEIRCIILDPATDDTPKYNAPT